MPRSLGHYTNPPAESSRTPRLLMVVPKLSHPWWGTNKKSTTWASRAIWHPNLWNKPTDYKQIIPELGKLASSFQLFYQKKTSISNPQKLQHSSFSGANATFATHPSSWVFPTRCSWSSNKRINGWIAPAWPMATCHTTGSESEVWCYVFLGFPNRTIGEIECSQ